MRTTRLLAALLAAAGASALARGASADPRLAAVFGDHAVLQRDRPIAVWGMADPGEEVTVSIAGRSAKATADAGGRFRVTLEPLPAGGPHELVAQGRAKAVARDVLVGEVWLCSGQSNMAWTVGGSRDADAEAAAGDLPSLRVFTVATLAAAEPAEDVRGAWTLSQPGAVKGFSAVAWFFGRELHRELAVPVGLVVSSVGGTVAEAWTPADAVEREEGLAPLWKRWQKALEGFDAADAAAKRRKALERWKRECESDRRAGRPPPPEPAQVADPRANLQYPGSLWRGMVEPLVPLSVRGFLWYQGESNAGRAEQYRVLFPTMIRAWRTAFGRDDLPFYFVQLANFGRVAPSGGDSAWAELREAQALALRDVPATGMAVAIDVGEPADIHPKNKQEVARRLSLWALAKDYGRAELPCCGPVLKRQRIEGSKVVLEFDHAGAALATSDGADPRGFAIAGPKGDFQAARARIDGTTVVVWSDRVRRPAAVRYAWADSPEAATLVGPTGLPAGPFRTDERPGVTAGKN